MRVSPINQTEPEMTRYLNFCSKLKENQMTIKCSEEEFESMKLVKYECPNGHLSSLSAAAFINKTAPSNREKLVSMCSECNSRETYRKHIVERLDELGFRLIDFQRSESNSGLIVKYACVCGNKSSTDFRNLKKKTRQAHCIKCQNDKNKSLYSEISKNFSDRGCVLLTPQSDYKNNKQLLDFKCICGNDSKIVLHDLVRGRLCINCKSDRSRQTSMEKYGTDNPSKCEEIKKKIVETMKEKHGVEYAQQHPAIRAKTDTTCMEKYGYKRAFLRPETFEKIRATHLKKYGVEFPLQSQEIQDKISLVFQATMGASRPFLSESFLQKMKEKYGHEWFCCTDRYKEIMLEKYGVENYIQSDHCKEMMMEKYGSEYFIQSNRYKEIMMDKYGAESPMQCPELFRLAQKSSYCRRSYICPDGKTFMVLGYEDKALDELFREEEIDVIYAGEDERIPIFSYIDKAGKEHKYYPDIYIPDQNRIIEVKSIYTYNRDRKKTLYKALKVSEDHLFELRLYNSKKEIAEVLECRNGIFYSHTEGLLELGKEYKI